MVLIKVMKSMLSRVLKITARHTIAQQTGFNDSELINLSIFWIDLNIIIGLSFSAESHTAVYSEHKLP